MDYRNTPPSSHPRIRGRCPSCGAESLFLGSEGYVTCAVIGCKDPSAAHDLLALRPSQRAALSRAPGEATEAMVEAGARAIYDASYGSGAWPPANDWVADVYRRKARACYAAMRAESEDRRPKPRTMLGAADGLRELARMVDAATAESEGGGAAAQQGGAGGVSAGPRQAGAVGARQDRSMTTEACVSGQPAASGCGQQPAAPPSPGSDLLREVEAFLRAIGGSPALLDTKDAFTARELAGDLRALIEGCPHA